MKRLLITLSMLLTLSGCATVNDAWDYFDMARFDNNEYMLANKVRTQANIGARKCGTPEISREVTRLWETTQELRNYSESIPRRHKWCFNGILYFEVWQHRKERNYYH